MCKFFFIPLFCLTAAAVHAQSYPLEGTWTLESAAVLKITGSDTVKVALDTVREELAEMLSETLEFKADTLTLSGSEDCGCSYYGQYKQTGNQISISFTPAPIRIEYTIADGKLHFRQQLYLGMEPPFTYRVLTVYNKQS
jgi:hypothetical protein